MLNCPLLHIVLYINNNLPTCLVFCFFQISIGSSNQPFHNNLLFIKLNLFCANEQISLSLCLWSWTNSQSHWKHMKSQLSSEKNSIPIYSKLLFCHISSVVPRSDNDLCASMFSIMLNDFVFVGPLSSGLWGCRRLGCSLVLLLFMNMIIIT